MIEVWTQDILNCTVINVKLQQYVSIAQGALVNIPAEKLQEYVTREVVQAVSNTVALDIQKMFEESDIISKIREKDSCLDNLKSVT